MNQCRGQNDQKNLPEDEFAVRYPVQVSIQYENQ